jgi:hypothetical protein
MKRPREAVDIRCRVWIVRYETFQPTDWQDVPSEAVAIEPAESGTMTVRQARRYVEAFNRTAFGRSQHKKRWAVAVPVTIRYDGDPRPSEKLPVLP